jgi:hypothetical protein
MASPSPGRGVRSLPSGAREEPRAAGGGARGRDKAGGTPADVPSERSRRLLEGGDADAALARAVELD